MDEVARSIRVGSTPYTEPFADWRRLGFALGGFVAGEGCFSSRTIDRRRPGTPPRMRFTFTVTVAARDRVLVTALHELLGRVGGVYEGASRRSGWQSTISLQVTALADHLVATIPFAEQFLNPAGHKFRQYRSWHGRLQEYRQGEAERKAARPTMCTTDGCDRPIRAGGLCRGCYWRATGN